MTADPTACATCGHDSESHDYSSALHRIYCVGGDQDTSGCHCDAYIRITTGWTGDPPEEWALTIARTAVAAARPIIEAEIRERIAAEIEAQGHPDGFHRDTEPVFTREDAAEYCGNCAWTIEHARIARGTA